MISGEPSLFYHDLELQSATPDHHSNFPLVILFLMSYSMHFDWTAGLFAEGLHCYRTEQFFEAHEHWESVWLKLAEPEKSFLQALVQISAAFHHLGRGNRVGAISLLMRALRRLDRSPSHFCGMNVERIRHEMRNWLIALQQSKAELPPAYPDFEIVDYSARE
jgi:uncharacterized protein